MDYKDQSQIGLNRKELIWLITLIAIALIVRIIHLGTMPFLADDACLAADALAYAQFEEPELAALSAYTGLTGTLFYIFGHSAVLARLLPVIAGSSLVVAAFLITKRYDLRAAIVFALALALDPFLVSMSRQIYSPLIALAGIVWTVLFIKRKKYMLAGFFASIAFLGGYYFWVFLIVIVLIWVIGKQLKIEQFADYSSVIKDKKNLIPFLGAFAVSLILVSTGFLLRPAGMGDIASGLVAFIRLFGQRYELPIYHSFYVLFAFGLFPLIGGIIWLTKKTSDEKKNYRRFIILFILIALILCVLFSRKDMGVAVLLFIPLWFMTAKWLAGLRIDIKDKAPLKAGSLFLYVVFMVYIGMNVNRLFNYGIGDPITLQIGLATIAGVLLVLIIFWLSSLTLGIKRAVPLFTLALVLILSAVMISKTFNSLDKFTMQNQLSLNSDPVVLGNIQQFQAIEPFEDYGRINFSEATVKVEDIEYDLRWRLREFATKEVNKAPEFIITVDAITPNYDVSYRGTRIELSQTINWRDLDIQNYFFSLVEASPIWNIETACLWAQTKLFTGAN
jgi:hypothetical protein